ncbi:MAG: glycosyltransferase family 4 protein [Candidatus Kerfeldbacteria bacterium]|nr:glycosyltransferase family 4 protein [Candidatus Kerfeldbacteria bacterium]
MNIGIVTQSYYPVLGGVTEHVYHLGRELVRRNHRVTVITGGAKTPEDRGLRVLRLGRTWLVTMNGATVSAVLGFGFARQLRHIQQRERFDLVHIHSPLDPWLPLSAARHLRGPLVGTFHTYRSTMPLPSMVRNRLAGVLHRLAARIAVSASAKEYAQHFGQVPFQIIPNGVDCDRFSPAVEPFPAFRDGRFTVIFVGRMDPRKGSRYLLQAIPYLERELPDYRLLIVGSGWRRKVYQQFIPPGHEQRVQYTGLASSNDLPRYYRSADVFCSPAVGGESFGIVLLEAMACGLPIVASDIPGYHHVMTDGRQGLFSQPRNPKDLADKIVALAGDPGRRRRMAEAGRATALGYDWKKIADRVISVYQSVV